ncbi:hypothetical protein Hypma_002122 [Hypsizygus marmoreus]|uniref:Uncharacterized protein n=1 Tax=Hypsizygus marmoreus TaxID=39966 RepID=A0A369K870_HYPMA|nr:hypothetical protein Hypma_002122 [Hypsizygus marmoreus]
MTSARVKSESVSPARLFFNSSPNVRMAAHGTNELSSRLFNGGALDSQITDSQYIDNLTGHATHASSSASPSGGRGVSPDAANAWVSPNGMIQSQHKLYLAKTPQTEDMSPSPSTPMATQLRVHDRTSKSPSLQNFQRKQEEMGLTEIETLLTAKIKELRKKDVAELLDVMAEVKVSEKRLLRECRVLRSINARLIQVLVDQKIEIPCFVREYIPSE